jgi:probable phosphomutase (TIGR03848 family)
MTGGAAVSSGAVPRGARPTYVLLVRHGATPTTGIKLPGRAPGLHLSDQGRQQAEAAARRIAELRHVSAVYASPVDRARETAVPIAQALGVALRIDRDLAEVEIGEWTGLSLAQACRRKEWPIIQNRPSEFRFPEGESFMEVQTRMTAAIARFVQRHRGGTIVAVSHADPIKLYAAHALGMSLDLFQRIVIATASITVVAWPREVPGVITVNSVDGHLSAYGLS